MYCKNKISKSITFIFSNFLPSLLSEKSLKLQAHTYTLTYGIYVYLVYAFMLKKEKPNKDSSLVIYNIERGFIHLSLTYAI